MKHRRLTAFTLIELLIVVAIIAILAAIAVPNFLEAQVRSKVSRVRSDLRTNVTALEAYRVDNQAYPPTWHNNQMPEFPESLTTPIPYMNGYANIYDILCPNQEWGPQYRVYRYFYFKWSATYSDLGAFRNDPRVDSFLIYSSGPNKFSGTEWVNWAEYYGPYGDGRRFMPQPDNLTVVLYDPTNGTVSWGAIARYGPG